MSILSSAKVGKYSIPLSEDILLKNNFYCTKRNDNKPYLAHHTFVKYGSGMYGIDVHHKRYRHSIYDALYIDTNQEGTDEQGNPKIVGYIGISTPIDLIDNGIWKFEITKKIEVFHDAYYDFHEYTLKNCCNVNVCEKTKVESLGNVMDFISSNKLYFLAVKKLKRNLLLKMGLI